MWLRQHMLFRLHRLLLQRHRVQLLPLQHDDGRLVDGRQQFVLRRAPLLHGLQRDLLCDNGCSGGFPFCEPGCDLTGGCGCGPNGCDSYLTSCLQFATASATRTSPVWVGSSAGSSPACRPGRSTRPAPRSWRSITARPSRTNPVGLRPRPAPRVRPPTVRPSTMISSMDGDGYGVITAFGKLFAYGDFVSSGDASNVGLEHPSSGRSPIERQATGSPPPTAGSSPSATRRYEGSMGGKPLNAHIVGMAPTPAATGTGWWRRTAASSRSETRPSWAPWEAGRSTPRSSAWRPPGRVGATGWWRRTVDLRLRGRTIPRLHGGSGAQPPIVAMATTATSEGYWLVAGTAASSRMETPYSTDRRAASA